MILLPFQFSSESTRYAVTCRLQMVEHMAKRLWGNLAWKQVMRQNKRPLDHSIRIMVK